jgi:hypothetical protein
MGHAIPIKTVVDRRVARAANYASKRSGWNAPDRLQQKRLLTAKARMASYYAAIISIAFAIRLLHLQIGLKCHPMRSPVSPSEPNSLDRGLRAGQITTKSTGKFCGRCPADGRVCAGTRMVATGIRFVPKELFQAILRLIDGLRPRPAAT